MKKLFKIVSLFLLIALPSVLFSQQTLKNIVYNSGGGKMLALRNAVAGGAGNATFIITLDGTTGTDALFNQADIIVIPFVNNSANNYTYSWTLSGDRKTLTINTKVSTGINVAALGLTLLGVPANVANGTDVMVLVAGT